MLLHINGKFTIGKLKSSIGYCQAFFTLMTSFEPTFVRSSIDNGFLFRIHQNTD